MRVLVVMSAYNEEDFLVPNIRTLYPYVDKIAISTTNHITGKDSDDLTIKRLNEFMKEDKEGKVLLRPLNHTSNHYTETIPYDTREGMIKTELMNMMEPEEGDWIFVVDADEFYLERQLEMLKGRYILGHNALQYNKHCIMVSAMVFVYNTSFFYFSRHGRIFRYKKESYFRSVNHFTWVDGTPVYGDEFGWDCPISSLCMFHARYVRGNLNRLMNRYLYRKDPAGFKKLKWFESVFLKYPLHPEEALEYNLKEFGVKGFDGATSGPLKRYDGELPLELKQLNFDLLETIRRKK